MLEKADAKHPCRHISCFSISRLPDPLTRSESLALRSPFAGRLSLS